MSAIEERLASAEECSLLLTVEEAAAVLRIGRTLAYTLARRYDRSGDREALPVVHLGGFRAAAGGNRSPNDKAARGQRRLERRPV